MKLLDPQATVKATIAAARTLAGGNARIPESSGGEEPSGKYAKRGDDRVGSPCQIEREEKNRHMQFV